MVKNTSTFLSFAMDKSNLSSYIKFEDETEFTPYIWKFFLTRDKILHELIDFKSSNFISIMNLLYESINNYEKELKNKISENFNNLTKVIQRLIRTNASDREFVKDLQELNLALNNIQSDKSQHVATLPIEIYDTLINKLSEDLNDIISNKDKERPTGLLNKLKKLYELRINLFIFNYVNQFDTLYQFRVHQKGAVPNDSIDFSYIVKLDNTSLKSALTSYINRIFIEDLAPKNTLSINWNESITTYKFSSIYYELSILNSIITPDEMPYALSKQLITEIYSSILEQFYSRISICKKNKLSCCVSDFLLSSQTSLSNKKNYEFPIVLKFIKTIEYFEIHYSFVTKCIQTYLKKLCPPIPLNFTKLQIPDYELSSYSIIGKLYPYNKIRVCSRKDENNYTYFQIFTYENYFIEKGTNKICLPINNFCTTDPEKIEIMDTVKNTIIKKDGLLFIQIPIITETSVNFNVKDTTNGSIYEITIFPTTCNLVESYRLYFSAYLANTLHRNIFSKFIAEIENIPNTEDTDSSITENENTSNTKYIDSSITESENTSNTKYIDSPITESKKPLNIKDIDLSNIDISQECYFLYPYSDTNDINNIKIRYLNILKTIPKDELSPERCIDQWIYENNIVPLNTKTDATSDTQSDATSDAETSTTSETETDTTSDTETGATSETQSGTTSETQSGTTSDTQSPMNSQYIESWYNQLSGSSQVLEYNYPDELLQIFRFTEMNFHRYILDIIT